MALKWTDFTMEFSAMSVGMPELPAPCLEVPGTQIPSQKGPVRSVLSAENWNFGYRTETPFTEGKFRSTRGKPGAESADNCTAQHNRLRKGG